MFINNDNVKIILIAHSGYYSEYNNLKNCGDFIPKCKNAKVILNLSSDFNSNVKNILDKTLSI